MKGVGLAFHDLDLILSVFRRNPSISEVLLYGSRAKGNYKPESDIDLAIVGVSDELQVEKISEELDQLPLPYRFDVVGYEAIRHSPLREHIERVGLSIYRRDMQAK